MNKSEVFEYMSKKTIEERLEEISDMLYNDYMKSEGWFGRGYADERRVVFDVAKKLLLESLEGNK